MELKDKERIRETVRDRYGNLAKTSNLASLTGQMPSCCDPKDIPVQIGEQAPCCGSKDVSLEQLSALMGYSKEDMDSVPEGANLGIGCGNPVALASLKPGETVVDLGSGGGFDCFLAAQKVGETGKVIGVDMTPDMIGKARRNAEKMKTGNVEFRLGEIEHLPVADNSAGVIMSNCVINLSPDKLSVYRDAYRILKPGGRLAISDIVATAPLPEEVRTNLAMLSACVGGAQLIEDIETMLKEVGFQDITIKPKDESRKLINKWVPGKNAGDFIVSAYIEAVKPI